MLDKHPMLARLVWQERLFWLLRFTWIPGFLRCVAQNPRILLMVNLIHYNYACVFFFSLPFFSSRSDVLHTVI